MLARIFGDCREGQIPSCLQRIKFDTPLLAAGSLIFDYTDERAGNLAFTGIIGEAYGRAGRIDEALEKAAKAMFERVWQKIPDTAAAVPGIFQ